MPPSTPACETCRFIFKKAARRPSLTGIDLECRRFPPQVVSDGPKIAEAWPIVGNRDWCGEWQSPDFREHRAVPAIP